MTLHPVHPLRQMAHETPRHRGELPVPVEPPPLDPHTKVLLRLAGEIHAGDEPREAES